MEYEMSRLKKRKFERMKCVEIKLWGQTIMDCKYEKFDESKEKYVRNNIQNATRILFRECVGRDHLDCPLNKEVK